MLSYCRSAALARIDAYDVDSFFTKQLRNNHLDFSDVKEQQNAKRAIEIETAGGHNILMIRSSLTISNMKLKISTPKYHYLKRYNE